MDCGEEKLGVVRERSLYQNELVGGGREALGVTFLGKCARGKGSRGWEAPLDCCVSESVQEPPVPDAIDVLKPCN
jgi:hypothetical protein